MSGRTRRFPSAGKYPPYNSPGFGGETANLQGAGRACPSAAPAGPEGRGWESGRKVGETRRRGGFSALSAGGLFSPWIDIIPEKRTLYKELFTLSTGLSTGCFPSRGGILSTYPPKFPPPSIEAGGFSAPGGLVDIMPDFSRPAPPRRLSFKYRGPGFQRRGAGANRAGGTSGPPSKNMAARGRPCFVGIHLPRRCAGGGAEGLFCGGVWGGAHPRSMERVA